ncbi:hypothetical protein [Hydrogenophaga sp. BPS33]|uniref:hypothetical protein n=1 Tax=Hydrogenophaga sp. BPS33 TaxID=2651974 RepID=UPI00131F760C|nr:hypothetical protein [Hydrogenophaga sp. BPS33]QHE83550.1 hypothetical protein F9K07_00975 [Hydrogenophaga sp. BPS33]
MKAFYPVLVAMGLSSGAAVAQTAPASAPAIPEAAFQNEVWINVGGFSRHFKRHSGYNESNLGLGVEWRTSPELSYMAGAYDNSVRKTTFYAAVNWQPWTVGPFKVGGTVGVMNGYPSYARGGAFFAAVPMASWEGRRYGINFGIIPSMGKVDGAVIVQFKLRVV